MSAKFSVPQLVRHKPTGDVLIARRYYSATASHGEGYSCSPVKNSNTTRGYPIDELETFKRKRGVIDYDLDIVPRAQGALEWEIVEPAPLAHTLSNISACAGWTAYPGIAWVRKPGDNRLSWARIFLHSGQYSGLTGQAHALVYESGPSNYPSHLRDAVVDAAVKAVHKPNEPAGNLAAAVLNMESVSPYKREPAMPSAWLLSICKHEVVDTGTASSKLRGWHPAHCSKCGMNLSVDCSD
jgi:hypothetical protein